MSNKKHYAAAIAAFILWGFFSLPLRALVEYSAGEILYFRILFSTLVLGLIIFGFKRRTLAEQYAAVKALPPQQVKQVVIINLLGGALLTVNWLIFIYIVNSINIKTASFSYLICPVITAALGYALLKETLTLLQWIAVGLCGVSCVMIGLNSTLELGYSFFTALTYALYLITQKRNQHVDRIIGLGVQVVFSFVILTLFYPLLVQKVPTSIDFYLFIGLIAVAFTVVPLFLNLFALNRINSATIGILMYLNPIINFSLAIFFFRETVSLIQVWGYAIIAAALVLFNYVNFKRLVRR